MKKIHMPAGKAKVGSERASERARFIIELILDYCCYLFLRFFISRRGGRGEKRETETIGIIGGIFGDECQTEVVWSERRGSRSVCDEESIMFDDVSTLSVVCMFACGASHPSVLECDREKLFFFS